MSRKSHREEVAMSDALDEVVVGEHGLGSSYRYAFRPGVSARCWERIYFYRLPLYADLDGRVM
jgi:hypothetical protein